MQRNHGQLPLLLRDKEQAQMKQALAPRRPSGAHLASSGEHVGSASELRPLGLQRSQLVLQLLDLVLQPQISGGDSAAKSDTGIIPSMQINQSIRMVY